MSCFIYWRKEKHSSLLMVHILSWTCPLLLHTPSGLHLPHESLISDPLDWYIANQESENSSLVLFNRKCVFWFCLFNVGFVISLAEHCLLYNFSPTFFCWYAKVYSHIHLHTQSRNMEFMIPQFPIINQFIQHKWAWLNNIRHVQRMWEALLVYL